MRHIFKWTGGKKKKGVILEHGSLKHGMGRISQAISEALSNRRGSSCFLDLVHVGVNHPRMRVERKNGTKRKKKGGKRRL